MLSHVYAKRRLLLFFLPAVLLLIVALALVTPPVSARETVLVTTVDELNAAIASARDGDVITVGDITFSKMPAGMIQVPKSVTIRSGKSTNAIFTDATFSLCGTTSQAAPLAIRFENIDFRGDRYGADESADAASVATTLPGIMQTMCAVICKQNLDVTCTGCTFEGYHYGYGGVFNAIYTSDDTYSRCTVTLESCDFRGNAGRFGGCVYVSTVHHNVTLRADRCTFTGNAASSGGAIFANNAALTLTECRLTQNRWLDTEIDQNDGGAIAVSNCTLDLDACVLSENESGGAGGAVSCRLFPFRTLTARNCTLRANRAAADGAVSLQPAETNLDTPAIAHFYFCSFLGNTAALPCDLAASENAGLFACLLADGAAKTRTPCEENGYCLTLSEEEAATLGRENGGHFRLPADRYPVARERTRAVAGGRFATSLATLGVGDQYTENATVPLQTAPRASTTLSLRYGDPVRPETPTRRGYAFAGWQWADGSPFDPDTVYLGGEPTDRALCAVWKWQLSENLYVIWVPALLLCVALALFFFLRRKKTAPAPLPEEPAVLPDGWIDRVMEKPEVVTVLSNRETEVLRKLLEGKSRKEIAAELFVTESAIRKHSSGIYAKFGVHNRTELLYKLTR